jgi:RNA polymerase sigma-70 factor (ECF subfamily)
VLDAIRALPARQRDCVLLRFYLDLSEADISRTLGISPGSVKTHLHRALAALGPKLEDTR